MQFVFQVTVELNRTQGKFETRETMSEAIRSEIESADPGSLTGDNEGEYEVSSWEVEDVTPRGR